MIFGWERCEEERKPNPYPLQEIMRKYNLKPNELIMIDDLKPGFDMAMSCNVDFASAGWSHTNSLIIGFMKKTVIIILIRLRILKSFYLNNINHKSQ